MTMSKVLLTLCLMVNACEAACTGYCCNALTNLNRNVGDSSAKWYNFTYPYRRSNKDYDDDGVYGQYFRTKNQHYCPITKCRTMTTDCKTPMDVPNVKYVVTSYGPEMRYTINVKKGWKAVFGVECSLSGNRYASETVKICGVQHLNQAPDPNYSDSLDVSAGSSVCKDSLSFTFGLDKSSSWNDYTYPYKRSGRDYDDDGVLGNYFKSSDVSTCPILSCQTMNPQCTEKVDLPYLKYVASPTPRFRKNLTVRWGWRYNVGIQCTAGIKGVSTHTKCGSMFDTQRKDPTYKTDIAPQYYPARSLLLAETGEDDPPINLANVDNSIIEFNYWDTDKNGTIDRKELYSTIRNTDFNEETKREIFSEFDRDGSGDIDYQEFYTEMKEYMAERDTPLEMTKAFRLFYDDKTGKISFKDDEIPEMIDEADASTTELFEDFQDEEQDLAEEELIETQESSQNLKISFGVLALTMAALAIWKRKERNEKVTPTPLLTPTTEDAFNGVETSA